jgi:thiosulfate dehydrogenase
MRFLLGFIFALLAIAGGGFAYFAMGYAPVATASAPMLFESRLAHMALNARLQKDATTQPSILPNDENLTAGAHIYRQQCAVCHGLPNQPETLIAKGMFPKVPQLFKHGVTDDPTAETYWKVANGIRLTGMPGFKGSLTDQEMWQVTLMLANAEKLATTATSVLQQPWSQQNW